MKRLILAVALAVCCATTTTVTAQTRNIYEATVVRVIDGDSLLARIPLWPQLIIETHIRLRGINTPELRGKCAKEKQLAKEVLAYLMKKIPPGKEITLTEVKTDKFGGRYDAVVIADNISINSILVSKGMAEEYDGKGARKNWCARNE